MAHHNVFDVVEIWTRSVRMGGPNAAEEWRWLDTTSVGQLVDLPRSSQLRHFVGKSKANEGESRVLRVEGENFVDVTDDVCKADEKSWLWDTSLLMNDFWWFRAAFSKGPR